MSVPGSSVAASGGQTVGRKVALLSLGCARNDVDAEELAARLATGGWQVSVDCADADVVVVNTCGFIEKAKQDSIDALLAAAQTGARVVATGCLAERYGEELAQSLPEVAAVLGFDRYVDVSSTLDALLSGASIPSHKPGDRRKLLPIAPAARPAQQGSSLREVVRRRLLGGPVASLKLATGCDRRCAFCAIPAIRGSFVSRHPDEILAEAQWLADNGVRELVLVSENSTSYGKDLGEPRLLEKLLPDLASVAGIVRVRVSYLQPAEVRPGLVEAIATTPGVAAYFDLSFQHSSESVLRRMRRFGSTERFLDLIDTVRSLDPDAGIRSNVIVGFPGERRSDCADLEDFLSAARLDAVGVFDYSDEDGTEAATLDAKVSAATIARRYARMTALADRLCAARAAERVGSTIDVLVDGQDDDGSLEGRAAHQAPEVDGSTTLVCGERAGLDPRTLRPGDFVRATVTGSHGVDLIAVPTELILGAPGAAVPAGLELG